MYHQVYHSEILYSAHNVFTCFCFMDFRTYRTSLVVWWSELLTANQVPGSIPVFTMGIFLEGEGSPW
jgi:hypothetical protein